MVVVSPGYLYYALRERSAFLHHFPRPGGGGGGGRVLVMNVRVSSTFASIACEGGERGALERVAQILSDRALLHTERHFHRRNVYFAAMDSPPNRV